MFPSLVFYALLQRLVELAQRLLGLDLRRDVCVGAEPTDHLACLVADRQGARKEPAVAAICATQRKCVFPGRSAFKTFSEFSHDTVDMVGVVNLAPTPALHVLESGPGIVEPALVEPVCPAGAIGGPGELADVVGELMESGFAFGERRVRPLALGNFLRDDIDAENAPLRP